MASETTDLPNPQPEFSVPGEPTLASIVERVEQALAAGDYELTAELMEQNYVAVLFGMLPSRFGEILDILERNGAPENGFVRTMKRLLFGDQGGHARGSGADESNEQSGLRVTSRGFPVDSAMRVGRMFRLRMAGRPVEAMRLAESLDDHFGLLDQAFGRHHGWGLYVKVQLGITAMLAGDFSAALVHFTQARMLFALPPYQFLARDACVKAAVIEALYGDEERARVLLDEADRIPRSSSWLEEELDAAHTIASSRVRAESPEEALSMLERLPLGNLGELWPFYVNALQRAFTAVGNLDESAHRLATFDQMSLLSVRGEGFLGSALPLATAMNAMILGDLPDARRRLESADGSIVTVKVLFAVLELAAARPQEALKRIAGLRDETRGLRFLEIWRLAVAAGSYYALGSHEECAEVLGFAVRMPGGVRPREARFFTEDVGAFARTRYETWPSEEETATSGPLLFSAGSRVLTDRELEVLRELRLGLTREQIAKAQYISINTLKAHLRSVYRKLGVNSRAGAVLEAERRGLI